MADGQIELADEPASAKTVQRFAQLDELGFQSCRRLEVLMVSGAGVFEQAGRAVLQEAAQPLAHGRRGGGEEPRGGFDAALFGTLHQAQAMVVNVLFHLTHQIKIASGGYHGALLLPAARRPALPPAGRPSPSASSHSRTSNSPGVYDVTRLFQI